MNNIAKTILKLSLTVLSLGVPVAIDLISKRELDDSITKKVEEGIAKALQDK